MISGVGNMAANGRAAGRTSAGDHTDSTSPLLSHSSPTTTVNEAGDDSLENRLTRSEGVSMPLFASAEAREQMAASPVRSPGSVRRYGSVNHHEYGMNPLALWHTEGNHVMSESGRRGSRRRSSNTLDEEFSIVSEEFLRSEETSEASILGTYVQIPVTEALELCTKSVLKPYNMFLKTVGWRKFRSPSEDLQEHCCRKLLNVVYLFFIIGLIAVVGVVQVLVCLRRDAVDVMKYNSSSCSNSSVCTECLKHSVTSFLIPDALLFVSYLYALYIFRFSEPEYLQMLTQTVFLGQASNAGLPRQKKLICTLRLQLLLGSLWLVSSLAISVFRVVARELSQSRVPPIWNSLPTGGRNTLEAFCVLGFVIFDLVYLSIVVNYSFQCQLLIYHVKSIKDRVLSHDWPGIGPEQPGPACSIDSILEKAMKEMDQLKIFVLHLNSHISWAVSLLMFIFVISVMDAFVTLLRLSNHKEPPMALLLVGLFSLVQWVSILAFPLVQAARLNASCHSLRSLGHLVRSRPLSYTRMSYLHLDSFLSYTATQQLPVKLLLIRVTPGVVCGVVFVIACVLVYLLQHDVFQWAEYL